MGYYLLEKKILRIKKKKIDNNTGGICSRILKLEYHWFGSEQPGTADCRVCRIENELTWYPKPISISSRIEELEKRSY